MAQPLAAGVIAPPFELLDQDGHRVRLQDFRRRRVLIYFYPKAMTPGCTQQACGVRDHLAQLNAHGVDILGISPDSVGRLRKFADQQSLTFPLLADEDHAVAEAYGVWGPKQFMGRTFDGIHRISFLIDARGKIEHVFAGFVAKEHQQTVLNYLEPEAAHPASDTATSTRAPTKRARPTSSQQSSTSSKKTAQKVTRKTPSPRVKKKK